MTADGKGMAGRLRTEAGHRRGRNGGDTLFGPFDKPADPIDPQSSLNIFKILSIYRNIGTLKLIY